MVHFFHEGGGPYLKGEKPPTPSSISNTGLIDDVPPLSANGPLRFIRIIYMGQAHKSNSFCSYTLVVRESLIHMCQFGSFFSHQSEEDFPFWSMAFTGSYLYYKIVR